MAKPKNRQTVYSVVRTAIAYRGNMVPVRADPFVVGVYFSLERAEEVKGRYTQEMKDKGFGEMFFFEVQASTYYDE